jgi:hypothetical protein
MERRRTGSRSDLRMLSSTVTKRDGEVTSVTLVQCGFLILKSARQGQWGHGERRRHLKMARTDRLRRDVVAYACVDSAYARSRECREDDSMAV